MKKNPIQEMRLLRKKTARGSRMGKRALIAARRDLVAEAHKIIGESGLLSASRWAVYDHLFRHGPATRNELDRELADGRPEPTYSRRLAEMERMGVIARAGERSCRVTGFKAELWDVTDRLPQKPAKRRGPTRAMVECLVAELCGEIIDPVAFVEKWRQAARPAKRAARGEVRTTREATRRIRRAA